MPTPGMYKGGRGSGKLGRKVPSGNKGGSTGSVFRGNAGGRTGSIPMKGHLPGNPQGLHSKKSKRSY